MSQWRSHGYRQWHVYHNVVDSINQLSDNTDVVAATGIDCEKLLLTLKAHYADMIQRWIVTPADEMNHKLSVFKNITNAVIAMRRAEILKVRLEIESAKLEILQQKLSNKSASSASAHASSSPECAATSHPKPKEEPANRKSAPAPAEPPSDPPAIRPQLPEAASPDPTDPTTWELPPIARQPANPPMPDRVRTFHRVMR